MPINPAFLAEVAAAASLMPPNASMAPPPGMPAPSSVVTGPPEPTGPQMSYVDLAGAALSGSLPPNASAPVSLPRSAPPTASVMTPPVVAPLAQAVGDKAASLAPPPPAGAGPSGVEPPQFSVTPPAFPLQMVSGGGAVNVPARETEMRGPTLRAAQGHRNDAMADAIGQVNFNNQSAASAEYATALDQERAARSREMAAAQSVAEREEEMAQRQADFDQSVRALSKMSLDPGRFWASRNTGQKIAGFVGIFLGGLAQGKGGGPNTGLDILNRFVDQDIKAQEFDYAAARDTAGQKQTAFAMAMQKYQSADAARAMARAAALDTIQAQIGQQAALWKSTDAANRAAMAIAALEDEKMVQIANGIMFAPARQVAAPRMFVDPATGIRYTEDQARALSGKYLEIGADLSKVGAQNVGAFNVESLKTANTGAQKADDGASKISAQLLAAGVPQARAAAERALKALNASEGGRLEAGARSVAPPALFSDSANAREQAYADFSSAAIKAIMGNATKDEVARAEQFLGSAADPASRRRAIAAALDTLEQIEKNAKAGASPEAQRTFDQRRQAAEGAPAAAPKGSKAGW